MQWLSQNWIWLALGIGMVLMMRRGGHGGCCGGGGHDEGRKSPAEGEGTQNRVVGGAGHQH